MNAIKAEDIAHVLRDAVAVLPGGRCRSGEAIVVFPSREQPVNPDHLRNILLYLFAVTADSAREKGFLVVIDMRGKQTWTNVRPILKALNSIENATITQVFIIKPDKFWEKQKAQMSLGTWKFEVEMVSFEGLAKFVDTSQLPRIIGGTHLYDHDDWLETRLELEKWIWHITEVMSNLETVRKEMVECEHPVDVRTAEMAVKRHANAKRTIFSIPVEIIENEAAKICDRISNPRSGTPNPDLLSSLPHVTNLVDSLRLRKGDVFKLWDNRRGELEKIYQQKLFEQDADKMIEMVRNYCTTVGRSIGDVGVCENDVARLSKDFEQFQTAVEVSEVTVNQVIQLAQILLSSGGASQSVEIAAVRLQDEWALLQDLIARRKIILLNAHSFFASSQKYFAELPDWTAKPGVNPSDVMLQPADSLEEAIKRHESFWVHVEEIYAHAFDDGSKMTKALKEAEAEDNVAREQLGRLTRAHKQLHDKWKDRKVLLHHMLAMIAFETDVKLVVDWLDQHGEPYLKKNINIGENVVQARTFQRNHQNFQKVAANTYDNVKKLCDVYRNVTESGSKMCDIEKMRSLMTELEMRIKRFTNRVETRGTLLKLSVLFHTHYVELTNWFGEMKRRFEDKSIDLSVEECEKSKERWVIESDETAQAYAVTVGEGKSLIQELQEASMKCEIDYTSSIAHIHQLISDIDEKNAILSNEWAPRRVLLQIGLKFAMFARNNYDVMQQIQGWEDDMRDMVESETFFDKADTVMPYHKDNQTQVRAAINNIRKTAKELTQALHSHGIGELTIRDGTRVADLIKENIRILDQSEKKVMKCADETSLRIQAACDVVACRILADSMISMIDREERHLASLGGIPANCREAEMASDVLKDFQGKIEKRLKEPYNTFVKRWRELMEESRVERDVIVVFNEQIQTKWRRLTALCEERNKLLKAAIACYKTYEEAVVPILKQLAKDYSQPNKDWCAQCSSNSPQDKVSFIIDSLSKHMEYKDRFIKGCGYAQKNGEIFLRYIQRTNVRPNERKRHEDRISMMKSDIRSRQSHILELWMKRKSQLDRCHSYILLDASSRQLIEWLTGEGEMKLKEYEKRGKSAESDEFGAFKLQVKEQKTRIQSFLLMAADLKDNITHQHSDDIENCISEVKSQFERFSKRVAQCEVVLRGDNGQISKDEFSLDRHSDSSIFDEKIVNVRKEENRKMLEPMRELIKSERDYIEDLERCVKIYVTEFDNCVKNGAISASLKPLRGEIFGNIERIYEFHNEKLLHELIKYENQPEAVGASFTVWIDLLNELYTEYCVNKEQKNYVIATADAVAFFNGIREKHNLEINNDVGSLLIKPVQRITRYRLLMEQLLKNCTGNADELREAYEVVISVPRRVNDLIHYNCLDMKESNVDELGPFVMQATLTVWEPRAYFKGRGKERQVFLFELSIVFAKRLEISPKNVRYVIKGKPLPLSEVSVVEHVEGDNCRFGLRVGTVASNDNRTDLRATSENVKVTWVRKIRELTQGLLTLNLGVTSGLSVPSTSSSAPRSVSLRSAASTSSGDRFSQDVDSLMHHRHSVQSYDSEQSSEVWIVVADFDGQAEGHLKVQKGDRVEIVEDQATDCADYVQVVICDNPSKHGLVPVSIIAPPDAGSVPDRPGDVSSATVSKRKSLRRIFANSSKERSTPSSSSSSSAAAGHHSNNNGSIVGGGVSTAARQSTPSSSVVQSNEETAAESSTTALGVLSAGDAASNQPPQAHSLPTTSSCATPRHSIPSPSHPIENEDCLPPPMQNITLNNTMDDSTPNDLASESTAIEEAAVVVTEKAEKTPEETARFKRQYVLMELVETEQDYVRDLTSVVEGYIGNLEKMDLPEDLVGKDKIIFANISQILDFHKTCFLKEIEKCMENYEAAGSAFVKYERRLHTLYVKYCQNKPKSDYLVSQDDFEQFFAETKAKLGHKVALCDLLIKPVQRIMKYQLLLKDILKFTERAKDRTDVLKKALQVMHVVPKACDDMMQVGRLQNFDGNLGAQGRLIHQGTLQISESTAGTTQKAKDRRIFLFEQSAIIADHIPPKKEFGNPTYIFKNQIMVNKMVFEANVADDPLRFVIKSSDPAQPTAFIANAQTQDEKDEWNRKIGEQLDQQKRLLAALVDPKRYMGGGDDLSSGMSNLNIGSSTSNDKKAPAKSPVNTNSKNSSPKKESKGKSLFSFGKKPAKSPTSPPPLNASASCKFVPVREGDIELERDEKVKILAVKNGYVNVQKSDGTTGNCPNYYLTIDEIPGRDFAEQIQYRREWYERVDETTREMSRGYPFEFAAVSQHPDNIDVILELSKCDRPVIIEEMRDIEVAEGQIVEMCPFISSHIDFTVTWHGPAVESRRARIQTRDNTSSRLLIENARKCDAGAYSAIARNSFGVSSTVAFLNVISIPDPPSQITCKLTGNHHEIRLKWKHEIGLKYCIEYKLKDDSSFQVASTNIEKCHVALRNFSKSVYEIRIFGYNHRVRSEPSKIVIVDFLTNSVHL